MRLLALQSQTNPFKFPYDGDRVEDRGKGRWMCRRNTSSSLSEDVQSVAFVGHLVSVSDEVSKGGKGRRESPSAEEVKRDPDNPRGSIGAQDCENVARKAVFDNDRKTALRWGIT